MRRYWKILSASAFALLGLTCGAANAAPTCDQGNGGITLPTGFCALVAADNIGTARQITVAPNGDVYVALQNRGTGGGVVALRDTKGDGHFDVKETFGDGSGTGIGLYNGYLYVAQTDRLVRWKMTSGQLKPTGPMEIVVSGMEAPSEHHDKGLAFDGAGAVYINVGPPSNACQVKDRTKGSPGQDPCPILDMHGGVWKFDASKLNQKQSDGVRVATGLREALAVTYHDGAPYVVMNNRDQLDVLFPEHFTREDNNDRPAEVMYRIEQGKDFGWPYCFFDYQQQKLLLNPEYGGDGNAVGRCGKFDLPVASFPAHWAPMAVTFYGGRQFPAKYRGGAFIAFHGSWNRAPEERPGAVVFQPFAGGKPSSKFEVFASGFAGTDHLTAPNQANARPNGVAVAPDGSLYITDSQKGKIWRVFYHP
jgi:glucose/arabinose dehydrogenase